MLEKEKFKIASETEVRSAITKFNTMNNFKILIKYAIFTFRYRFNIIYDTKTGFGCITIEDIIQNVFMAFLTNSRKWNIGKFPCFKDQFYSAFDSAIYNAKEKYFEKFIKSCPISDYDKQDNEIQKREDQNQIEIMEKQLIEMGASDEEILLFEPYILNGTKREVMAKLLNVSVEEITNLQKKLKRKLIVIANFYR